MVLNNLTYCFASGNLELLVATYWNVAKLFAQRSDD